MMDSYGISGRILNQGMLGFLGPGRQGMYQGRAKSLGEATYSGDRPTVHPASSQDVPTEPTARQGGKRTAAKTKEKGTHQHAHTHKRRKTRL